jgi:hypothetical protein
MQSHWEVSTMEDILQYVNTAMYVSFQRILVLVTDNAFKVQNKEVYFGL